MKKTSDDKPASLSHFDEEGTARMVDISPKHPTKRSARAHAFVRMKPEVIERLPSNPKGNPLEVARIAGIQAAKRTSDLIPMCHPLPLTHVDVKVEIAAGGVRITRASHHRPHRRGDGSPHRRCRRRAHRLRHDQGAGQSIVIRDL